MTMAKALQVTKENRGNYFATVGKLLGKKEKGSSAAILTIPLNRKREWECQLSPIRSISAYIRPVERWLYSRG